MNHSEIESAHGKLYVEEPGEHRWWHMPLAIIGFLGLMLAFAATGADPNMLFWAMMAAR